MKYVDACKLAYQKPADLIQGVISDIHSSLSTEDNDINEAVPSNSEFYYSYQRMNLNSDQ